MRNKSFIFSLLFFLIYYIPLATPQVYRVLDFNATGDGITSDTNAVRAALAAAANTNGGRVIFDSGYTFLTGCFNITSNVILDVRGKILGSINVSEYEIIPNLPWTGKGLIKQPLVFSYNANNITITGGGIVDGNGPVWYECMKNDTLPLCHPYGRPHLMQPRNTANLVVDNITLLDSPAWTLHLANVTNGHLTNLNISGPVATLITKNGIETDGIDIECSVNILVENSVINTGDDAVAIKAGQNEHAWEYGRPSENILVRNLTIGYSNGIVVGSEMSAGVRNVTFTNITLNGSKYTIRLKTERGRGGFIEDITYSNINVYNSNFTFDLTMNYSQKYRPPGNSTTTPQIKNIVFTDIRGDGNNYVWRFEGLPESPIQNIYLNNIVNTNTKIDVVGICTETNGICDNSTVLPYCPPCLVEEKCFDANTDCQQYINYCTDPRYRATLCDQCRLTCQLCNSC